MIPITRLNGKKMFLNALLIETVEETPDTMITTTNGKKITVLEKSEEVVELVRQYLRDIGLVRATVESMDSEGS